MEIRDMIIQYVDRGGKGWAYPIKDAIKGEVKMWLIRRGIEFSRIEIYGFKIIYDNDGFWNVQTRSIAVMSDMYAMQGQHHANTITVDTQGNIITEKVTTYEEFLDPFPGEFANFVKETYEGLAP